MVLGGLISGCIPVALLYLKCILDGESFDEYIDRIEKKAGELGTPLWIPATFIFAIIGLATSIYFVIQIF